MILSENQIHLYLLKPNQFFLESSEKTSKKILQSYLQCPIDQIDLKKSSSGKPFLASSHHLKIEFNISHSNDLWGMALCLNQPIGLDLEFFLKNRNFNLISRKFFSVLERNLLNQSENSNEEIINFYRIWTLKEAYVKYKNEKLFSSKGAYFDFQGNKIEAFDDKDHQNKISNLYFRQILFPKKHPEYLISVCSASNRKIEIYQDLFD